MTADDMIASPAYWRGKIEAYKEVQGFIEKVLPVMEMSLKVSKGIHKERREDSR